MLRPYASFLRGGNGPPLLHLYFTPSHQVPASRGPYHKS